MIGIDILENYKKLEYASDIDWKDIFAVWRSYEAYQEGWRRHWEERGFGSWDEWRENYIAPMFPQKKDWKVYRIKDFHETLDLYGVPSRGWIAKCYGGETTKRLGDILDHQSVKNNDKVKKIIKNFPHQTMLTGIVNNGKIILVEGMHRALALAIMSKKGLHVDSDVVIAIAEHEGEIPAIGKGDIIENK